MGAPDDQNPDSASPSFSAPANEASMFANNPQQQQQQPPPPRIFGNYAPDGSLLTPSLPQDYFQDGVGDFGLDDGPENGDQKRRRIAKACDACRRKKIRCDGKQPRCSHCENYKTECVFTHVEKKRQPPKGAKYIQGLENRLGRMEHLLKLSGLLSEDEANGTDLKTLEERIARQRSPNNSNHSPRSNSMSHSQNGADSTPKTSDVTSPDTQGSPYESIEEQERRKKKVKASDVETLSDMMCSLVTNKCGETRFIGSSSGFSIFSPRGIQWINEKTGDESFQNLISNLVNDDHHKWFNWNPEVFGDVFKREAVTPLPPQEECMLLIQEFFDNFNNVFPLFHEPTFRWLVEKQYSSEPYTGAGWWASLNVAIAIAYRIRVVKNLSLGDEDAKAWGYVRNALALHSELTLKNNDLLSVQALLGMSFFMQGTPNPQPSFSLTGSAIRLMHSIGLHKRSSGFGLNKTETEQRKRVFWLAYMSDKDMCLRSGRPAMQSDDDWNVDLPDEEPEDGVGIVTANNGERINLFRKFCEFSIISSRVYTDLYSVRASKQSDGELLNTIGDLDKELQEWKDSIPVDFRPEHEPNASSEHLMLQVVTVHFAYYNCLTTIHRMAIHHGVWTSRLSDYAISGQNIKPLNPRVYSSAALCVQAARASINLIKYIPQGDFACVWLILYYPTSALVTLFANILQNPTDMRAKADLKLMSLVVNFLSRICIEEETGSTRHIFTVCKEFERIARLVLQRAEKEMSSRQKRKQEQEQAKINENEVDPGLECKRTPKTGGMPRVPEASWPVNGAADQADDVLDGSVFNAFSASNAAFNMGQGPLAGPQGNELWTSQPLQNEYALSMQNSNTERSPSGGMGEGAIGGTARAGAFQQPFVPQELWSMPMTFEWDLGDMASTSNPFGETVHNAQAGGPQPPSPVQWP